MPSSPTPKPYPESEIRAIDALFERAGLQRSLRGTAAGVTERMRFERLSREDLMTTAPVPRVAANGVQWLSVPAWEKADWLWHGFSTRRGGLSRVFCDDDAQGELNLGFTAPHGQAMDDRETVTQNRRLLAEAVTGDAATPLVALRQIHSNLVVLADANPDQPWKADGLMTDEPGRLIGIQTADCIPILVADRKRHAVAAFHAGWRGTVKRIVESGIGRTRLAFGSRPEDLTAAIGPGIGQCCYAVGEEVLSEFESQFVYARELFSEVYDSDPIRTRFPMLFLTQRAPGHSDIGPSLHLNLAEANRRQLLAAGLRPRAIHLVGGCTSCRPEIFFSHRADEGRTGRMMSVIGIRPDAPRH
ncbi:MAG: peptidoglycan editing factor PgeF [Terracidiphilus sp.]|jgi:YfiH family protein